METETTIVRQNLMTQEGYTPYCGSDIARHEMGGCDNPRTKWNGQQFVCHKCGWCSKFTADFIERYKERWKII